MSDISREHLEWIWMQVDRYTPSAMSSTHDPHTDLHHHRLADPATTRLRCRSFLSSSRAPAPRKRTSRIPLPPRHRSAPTPTTTPRHPAVAPRHTSTAPAQTRTWKDAEHTSRQTAARLAVREAAIRRAPQSRRGRRKQHAWLGGQQLHGMSKSCFRRHSAHGSSLLWCVPRSTPGIDARGRVLRCMVACVHIYSRVVTHGMT
jgi:hypothetical protein